MQPDDIILRFIYDIDFGYDIDWWYLDFNKHATYDGQFEFKIDLKTLDDTLSRIDLDSEGVGYRSLNNYITINDFQTSADLLGTMVDAEVEFHLLTALTDLLGAVTGIGPLLGVLSIILDDINLVAEPRLSGQLSATISTSNDAIQLDTSELDFSEGQTSKTIGMTVAGGHSESGIVVQDMTYHMQFATDWTLEFDLSDGMNLFVDDFGINLGTWPDITLSSDEHNIEASTTTGFVAPLTMSIGGGGIVGLVGDNSLLVVAVVGVMGVAGLVVFTIVVKKRYSR